MTQHKFVIRTKKSIYKIKYWLDRMLIPACEEIPLGYECNQKTWNSLDEIFPKIGVRNFDDSYFTPTFVSVREGLLDGFHPVYDLNHEHIPPTVKRKLKKAQEIKKYGKQ